jgi:hypothetical protein
VRRTSAVWAKRIRKCKTKRCQRSACVVILLTTWPTGIHVRPWTTRQNALFVAKWRTQSALFVV